MKTEEVNLKSQSIGFAIGKMMIFLYKFVKKHNDNPEMVGEVREAKLCIGRWKAESRCKKRSVSQP